MQSRDRKLVERNDGVLPTEAAGFLSQLTQCVSGACRLNMIRATLAALVKAAGLWPGLSWVDSELRDVFMLPASGDDVESRRHAGLNQENRSRAGMRPISARKWTDLEPECDRSRRGSGPISERRGVPGGSPGREVSAQPSLRGDEDQRPQ